MPTPTFSEFAKTLSMYFGGTQTIPDFIVHLVSMIMAGQPSRAVGEGHNNPLMGKDKRILQYYFSGERQIPSKDASLILGRIDRCKFENYINGCSEHALKYLDEDLKKLPQIANLEPNLDTAEKCADIFVAILKDRASSGRKMRGSQG